MEELMHAAVSASMSNGHEVNSNGIGIGTFRRHGNKVFRSEAIDISELVFVFVPLADTNDLDYGVVAAS